MDYRLYASGDFDALYAIEERCFRPPERFGRRYMRELVNSTEAAAWIAEENGRMAGFAIVEWARQAGGTVAYLQTIEVDPEMRGRGVARELLKRGEDAAKGAGAGLIWLNVDEQNEAAIRLYQSSGYLCRGRQDGYYGRGRAALIYEKALSALGSDVRHGSSRSGCA